jgi:hypothetical protein
MCGEIASSVREFVLFVGVLAIVPSQLSTARALCFACAGQRVHFQFGVCSFFLFFWFMVSHQSHGSDNVFLITINNHTVKF